MSSIVVILVLVGVISVGIVVAVMFIKAPKTGAGKACAVKSDCEGSDTPESKVECKGGICTGEDGKFLVGGACAVVSGQRTSACPDGHYCGRVPAECNPVGTKVGALCAMDIPDESCGYEVGADGKPTDIKLKCDGFGYCQRAPQSVTLGGTCKASSDCKQEGDGKTCCSDGKCTAMVKKGEVWWCPGDPLDAAATTVANTVSTVAGAVAGALGSNEVKVGARCGIGAGTCAPGSRCCVEPASNLTTCQVPVSRPGDTRPNKELFCPSDPVAAIPWPLSRAIDETCTANDQCKGYLLFGGAGTPLCCGGKCKASVRDFVGIKCP